MANENSSTLRNSIILAVVTSVLGLIGWYFRERIFTPPVEQPTVESYILIGRIVNNQTRTTVSDLDKICFESSIECDDDPYGGDFTIQGIRSKPVGMLNFKLTFVGNKTIPARKSMNGVKISENIIQVGDIYVNPPVEEKRVGTTTPPDKGNGNTTSTVQLPPSPPANRPTLADNCILSRTTNAAQRTDVALFVRADSQYKNYVTNALQRALTKEKYRVHTAMIKDQCATALFDQQTGYDFSKYTDYILLATHKTDRKDVKDQFGEMVDHTQQLYLQVLDAKLVGIDSPFVGIKTVHSTPGDDPGKISSFLREELNKSIAATLFNF